ncbi:ABC transporter substrate-binding protein [Belnapia sp. T6]|uniref:ABC transporter substrate-binding protein n=2 Tax=Belnapia mucosa TaxID=2804532 RepID=A0ABS1V7C3_9PROT|nr:ABC transporter substrate-binding protein [Belnapia mucosa]
MRITRRALLGTALAASAARAQAAPIKIGDINSYTGQAAFTVPYRNGLRLALAEINAAGGVLGRPLELLLRDDGGKPEDAVRHAGELTSSEGVVALTGTFASNIGLAVADFAKRNRVPFLAAEALSDALTWRQGNRYTFRVRSSTYMQAAMLAEQAARLPARRWAVVAPNYEFGLSATESFRRLLSAARPDVEWVAEQFPALGRLEAGPVVNALLAARPEAIFNATFGADLVRLVRQGNDAGLFEGRSVVSVMTGQPEFLDPLGDEAPPGWIVTGYPWEQIATPAHQAFVAAYRRLANDTPRAGSLSGYVTLHALAAALRKAGGTEPDRIVAALEDLVVETPLGPIRFRASDHQSTLGMYVGRLAVRGGRGVMVDAAYADGARYLPPDDEVRRLRPQD